MDKNFACMVLRYIQVYGKSAAKNGCHFPRGSLSLMKHKNQKLLHFSVCNIRRELWNREYLEEMLLRKGQEDVSDQGFECVRM